MQFWLLLQPSLGVMTHLPGKEDVMDKFLPSESVKVPTWLETGVILSSQVTAVFVVPVEVPEEQ